MNTPGIWFTVIGRPQQKGSKRWFSGVRADGSKWSAAVDMNAKSRAWQDSVAATAGEVYCGELLQGPVRLTAQFYFSRPKAHYGTGRNSAKLKDSAPQHVARTPDLSKLVRTLEDGLTGVVWRDDAQVVEYFSVEKLYTEGQERTEIRIEPKSSEDVVRIDAVVRGQTHGS